MGFTFENVTTKEVYTNGKQAGNFHFENVPNTAAGYERTRCYITVNNIHKYFLSANTEKDYFLMYEGGANKLTVYFEAEGDMITIKKASDNGRTFTAGKYLKKYAALLAMIHSCIKYDKIIEYIRYI